MLVDKHMVALESAVQVAQAVAALLTILITLGGIAAGGIAWFKEDLPPKLRKILRRALDLDRIESRQEQIFEKVECIEDKHDREIKELKEQHIEGKQGRRSLMMALLDIGEAVNDPEGEVPIDELRQEYFSDEQLRGDFVRGPDGNLGDD